MNMLRIFKPKPLLSPPDFDFQVATYTWLLKNFGGKDFYADTQLVLPTKKYFPSEVETEEDAARETFLMVKKYAGMEEWPCKLVAQEDDIDPIVGSTIILQGTPNSPLGTFEVKDDSEVIVTYNPSIVRNPTQLVATFAHELAHYLTGSGPEEPPGGWENWEFATDIAATFLGFGVFMANSAANFQQFSSVDTQGWQFNRSGYLAEEEHVFALAIFLQLKNLPLENASRFLKPNLRKLLKRAMAEVRDSGIVSELASIKPGGANS